MYESHMLTKFSSLDSVLRFHKSQLSGSACHSRKPPKGDQYHIWSFSRSMEMNIPSAVYKSWPFEDEKWSLLQQLVSISSLMFVLVVKYYCMVIFLVLKLINHFLSFSGLRLLLPSNQRPPFFSESSLSLLSPEPKPSAL